MARIPVHNDLTPELYRPSKGTIFSVWRWEGADISETRNPCRERIGNDVQSIFIMMELSSLLLKFPTFTHTILILVLQGYLLPILYVL